MTRTARVLLAASALAVLLAACTDNTVKTASTVPGGAEPARITVESTAKECNVSKASTPSGNVVFSIVNKGDQVTEFYLFAEDGVRVIGEVEDIGPGLSRDLVVRAAPGAYVTMCKPGMAGDGIRGTFTVS